MTVLNLLVGIGFCLAAVVFRRTRLLALLAAATGVLWFLGDVVGFLVFAHRGPLTHLLLIYPNTRLRAPDSSHNRLRVLPPLYCIPWAGSTSPLSPCLSRSLP